MSCQKCDARALFGDPACDTCKILKSASVQKQKQEENAFITLYKFQFGLGLEGLY
jgi:hypothetical protein